MGNSTPTAQLFPDLFVGRQSLQNYAPNPIITNTVYSSNAPASADVVWFDLPNPVAVKNFVGQVSMNASVPGATSQNSSGSEAYSYCQTWALFSRQDYAANSTNLFPMFTASGGVTGTISYSSGSQSYGLSWVTDSTGGVGTFSTTSGAGNWSSFATGAKFISVPWVTTLPAGEYWLAFQHSSTTATSGSNVTLLSFSMLQQTWPFNTMGSFGGSGSIAFSAQPGIGVGVASALTTSTTMAGSVVSAATQPQIWFALSNA